MDLIAKVKEEYAAHQQEWDALLPSIPSSSPLDQSEKSDFSGESAESLPSNASNIKSTESKGKEEEDSTASEIVANKKNMAEKEMDTNDV